MTVRRVVTGEAGAVPALVLASVAMVIAFIATAGPRALASAYNRAVSQAVAQAPALDMGALVTAQLPVRAGPAGTVSAATVGQIADALAKDLPAPQLFPAAQHWAGVTLPIEQVLHPARSAQAVRPPVAEVGYRDALARHCVLVTGALPTGPAPHSSGAGALPGPAVLPVAATQAVAARFSLRVGSLIQLASPPGDRPVRLEVTGIVRPTGLSSAFWQRDPLLATPQLADPKKFPYWMAGFLAGPGDLAALSIDYAGSSEQLAWFYPISARVTGAEITRLESGLAGLSVSQLPREAEVRWGGHALQATVVSNGLADGLAAFDAQWTSVSGADSLLALGLFAAGIALLLICCGLAAEAYRTELVLLRVRGGSVAQLVGRMLVRSSCIAVPGLACGAVLAAAVLPHDASTVGWVFLELTALTAVAATPLICALRYRKLRFADAARRTDLVTLRPSLRRLAAELFVLLVAAAAIADVRLRGTGSASTVPYLSASAVLVAIAVGLVVNRVYRAPLRAVARAAAHRRGPVGAVGLARAARAPAGSVLPALTLILTLTLAAFAIAVGASVSAGQVAASWAQLGADATISAAGAAPVTSADVRAVRRVPGVVHATAVYTAPSSSPLAGALASGRAPSAQVGLAVVNPASYGALSADTPWPGFPERAMSSPRSGAAAAIPILVTTGAAARAAAGSRPRLELDGLIHQVRVVGTVTDTAAMPGGGDYVVLPDWAAPDWPAIPSPYTILVTGPAINFARLRAVAGRVQGGSQIAVRQQVLSQLTASSALRVSRWLYLIGLLSAAALSALAVLFALAGSARGRAAMLTRLGALGMSRRQSLLLGLTDAIPLVWVAGIGAVAASWLLVEVIGPVLGLNVFTGSVVQVPLRPTWQALVIPLAGVAVLAAAVLAVAGAASGRRELAAAVRQEEEAG
jgi:putative ABC transport system permease protein